MGSHQLIVFLFEEIKNVTSDHIRNVTEIDFSFLPLSNTVLPSHLCCFKQAFSHKNHDINELFPQFVCHAYNTEGKYSKKNFIFSLIEKDPISGVTVANNISSYFRQMQKNSFCYFV